MTEAIYTILMSNGDEIIEVEWTEGALDVEFQQQGFVASEKYILLTILEIIASNEGIVDNLRYDMELDRKYICLEAIDHMSSTCTCCEDLDEESEEFFPIGVRKEIR